MALERIDPALPNANVGYWRRRWRILVPAIIVLASFSFLAILVAKSIHSAILIGGDECVEVTKGFLWANGCSLYKTIWNDQPPLYTGLLAILFKCFAPSIGVARCLAVGFGLSLLVVFFIVVKKRFDSLTAWIATFSLLTAPGIFTLFISAMLEVPAIGTGLWALWPIYRWVETRQQRWLIFSGLIFSIAMQIKWTAAVLVPALAVEILLASPGVGSLYLKNGIRNLMVWGIVILCGFVTLGAMMGVDYRQALSSHFSQRTLETTGIPLFGFSLKLSPNTMPWHLDGWGGAGMGVLMLVLRQDWRRLAFPLILLSTVTLVHLLHRPYWSYYYLHFSIPLAWLTGYGMAELYSTLWKKRDAIFKPTFAMLSGVCATWILTTLIIGNGGGRLITDVQEIRNLPRVENNLLILEMKKYAGQTKWAFAEGAYIIYPFDARLKVIPELAVLPTKRFWSGQLDDTKLWGIVKQYRPEQILLDKVPSFQSRSFIESNYTLVYEDDESDVSDNGHRLYISKTLAQK